MSTEGTIIAALKAELEGITKTNGYNTNVADVIEGAVALEDIPNKPALGLTVLSRDRENAAFGTSMGRLRVSVWGYVDVQKESYTAFLNLQDDVEALLETWTYAEFTNITNTNRFVGGIREMLGLFELEVEVSYFYDTGNP